MIIEGDCLRVIHALVDSGRCKTLFGQVIEVTKTKRLGGVISAVSVLARQTRW